MSGGIIIVAVWIFLWSKHKTLSINGVIVPPIGYWGYSDAHFEGIGAFSECKGSHIASEAPSEDANAGFIDEREVRKPLSSSDLVFDFVFTEIFISCFFVSGAFVARTTTIYTDDEVSFLCKVIEPESIAIIPSVSNGLRAWT